MTANDLTRQIILEAEKRFPGTRLWRANTGSAVPIAIVKQAQEALRNGWTLKAISVLSSARPISFGLAGSPDIDGFLPGGRRIGIEVKIGRDSQNDAQEICQQVYERGGCVYILARDLEGCMAQMQGEIERVVHG